MMLSFNDFLTQILQPYFFYSLAFLSLSFVCIKVFLKFNPFVSRRIQSMIWLIPLFIPISVMFFFHPQTLISMQLPQLPKLTQEGPISISATTNSGITIGKVLLPSVFSITGLLCLGGAIAATAISPSLLSLGRKSR